MTICFPVMRDDGVRSRIYDHFSSAPVLAIFNSEENTVRTLDCHDRKRADNKCDFNAACENNNVHCVITKAIGEKALRSLNEAGVTVYRALSDNVKENIMLFRSVGLPVYRPANACMRCAESCAKH